MSYSSFLKKSTSIFLGAALFAAPVLLASSCKKDDSSSNAPNPPLKPSISYADSEQKGPDFNYDAAVKSNSSDPLNDYSTPLYPSKVNLTPTVSNFTPASYSYKAAEGSADLSALGLQLNPTTGVISLAPNKTLASGIAEIIVTAKASDEKETAINSDKTPSEVAFKLSIKIGKSLNNNGTTKLPPNEQVKPTKFIEAAKANEHLIGITVWHDTNVDPQKNATATITQIQPIWIDNNPSSDFRFGNSIGQIPAKSLAPEATFEKLNIMCDKKEDYVVGFTGTNYSGYNSVPAQRSGLMSIGIICRPGTSSKTGDYVSVNSEKLRAPDKTDGDYDNDIDSTNPFNPQGFNNPAGCALLTSMFGLGGAKCTADIYNQHINTPEMKDKCENGNAISTFAAYTAASSFVSLPIDPTKTFSDIITVQSYCSPIVNK